MEDLKLLRNRISELQAEITKLKSSKKFVVRYVDSITIPQQLDVNTFYINKTTNQFGTWSEITRDFDWIDIGGSGYSFDDIASFFVGGTDIGITVDSVLETITIAYTGTSSFTLYTDETLTGAGTPTLPLSVVRLTRRFEKVSNLLHFTGFANDGSLETDAVWTIHKIIYTSAGVLVSNTEFLNKKWSERGLL